MIKIKHLRNNLLKKNINFYIFFILIISSLNILTHFIEKKILGNFTIFGDFLVYRCAGIKFLNNDSPYGINKLQDCLNSYPNSLDFFYPPITLKIFSLFGYLNLNLSLWIWSILIFSSILSIIFISYKFFSKNNSIFIVLLIFFFSFGGLNWTGLMTGNISIIIYGLISLGIFYLSKKKNNYFYFIIILCSIIKPTYFIFAILPFFISQSISIKELYKITISLFALLAIYLYSYLNTPILFSDFLNHLQYGRSEEFKNIFGQGFGLFSLINSFSSFTIEILKLKVNIDAFSNIIWISIILLFISYSLLLQNKREFLTFNQRIAYGISVITLCYPLLKHYECFLIVPCLYFLINNYKKNFKYLLIIFMFSVHDKYAVLFILIISFVCEILFIKKRDYTV